MDRDVIELTMIDMGLLPELFNEADFEEIVHDFKKEFIEDNKVKAHLKRFSDWDRQFVSILAAVSQEIVLNILHRFQDQADRPRHLALKHEPVADCDRYDLLRREAGHDA